MTRYRPIILALLLICGGAAFHPSHAAPPVTNAPLTKRMVWAHCMICYPLDLDVKALSSVKAYRECYPLLQQFGLEKRTQARWQYTDIVQAKAAGIDAFAIDLFTMKDVDGAAEAYLASADQAGDFLIAMTLDLSVAPRAEKEDQAYRIVAAYCDIASRHPSAARVDGKFVIETYGTDQLDPAAWHRVRGRLAEAGYKTYWVASVDTGFVLRKARTFPADKIVTALDPFEGGYIFEFAGPWWNDLISLFASEHRSFMGGVKPGYYRYNGSEVDPENTAHYRAEWERDIRSPLTWNTVITWNDLGETTGVMPTGDWNATRSDITAWYAALYKGTRPPFTKARLYVTTTQMVYPGTKHFAEALVLNPLGHAVRAKIGLIDAKGKPFGQPVTAEIAPRAIGAATVEFDLPRSFTGSFIRASATLIDEGAQIASVMSAPILVLDAGAQSGYGSLCYSIPAGRALPGKVGLRLIHGAAGEPDRIAAILPDGMLPRFVEILHNASLVSNTINGNPMPLPIPARDSTGALIGKTEWGFYVARITDSGLRVGYSDPIYIAPPAADYSVRESYEFNGAETSTVTDSTPFKNAAVVKGGTWISPGYRSDGACLALNGTTSRVNLVPSVTPAAPMRLTFVVRPHSYGGVVFADTGGLIVSLRPDGRVCYTRLVAAGSPWATAVGSGPLPLNQWSKIDCTWDGTTIRIFINDQIDGSAACGEGFDSYIRALGCNPFGLSSDYFNGDTARFESATIAKNGPAAAHPPF
ncbi:MAG: endo-1,3-alpha-glucanase family glycosylhydrolase [Capsulimonadaceae bacterium]|nr:endo-1,3-alpha-glucanase family glycosylhydrolase [Capsulimonadaceae bacterium]